MENYNREYRNTGKSWFMQGMFYGAMAGAAISLFDQSTRKSVLQGSRQCMRSMKEYLKNPNQTLQQVKEATGNMRATIEKIADDAAFISQRVEEMKNIPPQVAHVVKETKEAFATDQSEYTPPSYEGRENASRSV
ncbi:YtxH domain-containing protein [Peribacillus sp. B-H-3]|jgi:gas vesicle protein|uniref:YtxH domain-containing protein n=1 Tax=Peribacillus sp. B-H-3 TaxID=3400420 RepID=UPI003B011325